MTGVIINNNEYEVSTGNTKIEYSSTGDSVSYSVYGEDIPVNPVIKEYTFLNDTTVHLKAGRYRICAIGGGASGLVNSIKTSSGISLYLYSGCTGGYLVIEGDLEEGDYTIDIGFNGTGCSYFLPDAAGTKDYRRDYRTGYATTMTGPKGQVFWVTGGTTPQSPPSGDSIATYSNFTLISRDIKYSTNSLMKYTSINQSSASGTKEGLAGFSDYNGLLEGTFGNGGGSSCNVYNKRNGSFSVSGGTPGVVTMRKIG